MCDDDNNRDETCVLRGWFRIYCTWFGEKGLNFFCHHGFVR
jgi:hypothetical protein